MNILKLLIVDDEPGLLRGSSRALKKFKFLVGNIDEEISFDITECSTGEEAEKRLAEENFDLLLLDYKLPDRTGFDILSLIKSKNYPVLTIIMTAYASLDVAVSAMKNGATDFLAKPFTPEELREIVRKVASNIILLRKAKSFEEEKRKVRFEFISILSHELKAPLSAVEGYLNLIDNKMLGNDISSYQDMIKRSLSRLTNMKKLILDILDLTRIESQQKKRELFLYNITQTARTSIETYSVLAKERNISFEVSVPEELFFLADRTEIEIIFNNLVSNAVKYNRDNGKVVLAVSGNEKSVTIKISDTGIGLKPEEKAKLFGEFVRIKNEKTKNIEGSGLGLSILKKLVSLYNGTIEIQSEYDRGTTFLLTLNNSEEKTDK